MRVFLTSATEMQISNPRITSYTFDMIRMWYPIVDSGLELYFVAFGHPKSIH